MYKDMKTIIRIFAGVLGALAFFVFASDCEDLGLFIISKVVSLAALIGAYLLGKSTYSKKEWEKMMSEE